MCFPPACPDLNPQEYVWDPGREANSQNHIYPVFDRLIHDFEIFLVETPFQTDFIQEYGPPIDPVIF